MTSSSGSDGDWTDTEAEGQPDLEAQPPGIDSETASEGRFPPRDAPVAVDQHGVTAADQEVPESVAERARHERPDVPPGPSDEPAGRLVDLAATSPAEEEGPGGEWEDDGAGLSAEEAAVHVRRQ